MKYLYKELICALAVLFLSGCSGTKEEKFEKEAASETVAESKSVKERTTLQPCRQHI